ncbi:MAG TPA: hypothetical protein VII68_11135 [Casimicrobiaceae bacterium]|jgi:hypothetical protein
MNERGRDIMAELRGFLDRFPGATSMNLAASERWALLLVRAGSDEAVVALSEMFGLTCEFGFDTQKWWRRATGEAERGQLRIVVAGPPHEDAPPS